MSLATRCPHCNTIFKVVQDQLKVSEGWVRCGRCNEVFNALEGLFDMEREPPPQRTPAVADTVQTPPIAAPEGTQHQPAPPEFSVTDASLSHDALADAGPEWAETTPGEPEAPMAPPASVPDTRQEPSFAPEPIAVASMPPVSAPPQVEPAIEPPAEPVAPEPSTPPGFDDIALFVPESGPATDMQAVTSFELELPPSALDARVMSAALSASPAVPPAPSAPASAPAPRPTAAATTPDRAKALPVTDESDALDSRYLLPSDESRPTRRRRRRGPDFADAQFPMDAMTEDDWATDWGDSDLLDPVSKDELGLEHLALDEPVNRTDTPEPAAIAAPQTPHDPRDAGPTTIPSRFGDDYRPEQALPPPSQRKGRPGTRGRQPQADAPEFIKQAERKAIWRHPVIRAFLSIVALALSATLALQVAHHWRNQIAAQHPAAAPMLAKWCQLAHCKLSAPMQIEDLQVDNIALVKTSSEGPDSYRVTAIIHNRADIALAWPQLDLTLTDSNGEIVARRALATDSARRVPSNSDATASAPETPVPEAVPAASSTTLQWHLRAPDLRLAGYTAELFYP